MRYYIATVWFLAAGKDDSFWQMKIFRIEAETELDFIHKVREVIFQKHGQGYGLSNFRVDFGPISLSKEQ